MDRIKGRIGHIYPLRRRIGHIYPLKRLGDVSGCEDKAENKMSKDE